MTFKQKLCSSACLEGFLWRTQMLKNEHLLFRWTHWDCRSDFFFWVDEILTFCKRVLSLGQRNLKPCVKLFFLISHFREALIWPYWLAGIHRPSRKIRERMRDTKLNLAVQRVCFNKQKDLHSHGLLLMCLVRPSLWIKSPKSPLLVQGLRASVKEIEFWNSGYFGFPFVLYL